MRTIGADEEALRELGYEDCLRLRGRIEAMMVKLYLKFLHEVTGDERYEKLYARVRVPSRKQALPEVLTREQVETTILKGNACCCP